MERTEKQVELYFTKRMKDAGGVCWKLNSTSTRGVPDRIVFMPSGFTHLVEFKSRTGKLSASQKLCINELTALDQSVFIVDSKETANEIADYIIQLSKHKKYGTSI